MAIRPEEITNIIKEKIEKFDTKADLSEVGTVIQVGDGIARVYGLRNVKASELVDFGKGIKGMAMNLEYDNVGCVLMGPDDQVHEGSTVKRTGEVISIPVGDEIIGRVVDPLGRPLDGKKEIKAEKEMPMDIVAPGIVERQPVKQPLQTGLKAVDALVPIGKGQRELIVGDRQTGKTAIAIDAIINQKNLPPQERCLCIYVAVGQKNSTVAQVVKTLTDFGAMEYTTVVAATASDPASMLYIAPYAGCAIGEYFMWKGKDVLIVYDDLSKHAQAYREMSLLLRRPPGREAYPGDVFYLHSRLLERACKLSKENGGGSLTALPIIETQANDVSAYIPTNVISITDGQIYLESSLFLSGVKPAINVGLSVSRVGGSAQRKTMRKVAGTLRVDMSQYQELAGFAQFGSELDKESQRQIERGKRMNELLKQDQYQPMRLSQQVLVLYAGVHGYTDGVAVDQVRAYEKQLLAWADVQQKPLMDELDKAAELTDELTVGLDEALTQFQTIFHGKK